MITVLGASGFIGSHLVKRLEERKLEWMAPGRDDKLSGMNLGDVIYCIGLTSDFRSRLFDTVSAHACKLLEVLQGCEFDSLLYLSSTRLYDGLDSTSEENTLRVAPLKRSDLYNISKAMGESIALNCGRRTRVVRISNVYGADFSSDNFLPTIIREAITRRRILLQTSAASAKDYVSVDDVVDGLISIATSGSEQIYNLGSGINVSNGELVESLQSVTGCAIEFSPAAPTISFPPINIERMQTEFDFQPSMVLEDIAALVELYRNEGISA